MRYVVLVVGRWVLELRRDPEPVPATGPGAARAGPASDLTPVEAPIAGAFLPSVPRGHRVRTGQVIGLITDADGTHEIQSYRAGRVATVLPAAGAPVARGDVLLTLEMEPARDG
jgi:biotin carboxyl carrier protein